MRPNLEYRFSTCDEMWWRLACAEVREVLDEYVCGVLRPDGTSLL